MEYCSKTYTLVESKYDLYETELMAVINVLEEWRLACEGVLHPVHVLPDHKNIEYFQTKNLLNQRQAWWTEVLLHFNCQIIGKSRKLNWKPDALIRKPEDLPEVWDEIVQNMEQAVLKPQNLPVKLYSLVDSPLAQGCTSLYELSLAMYITEPLPRTILEAIRMHNGFQDILRAECTEQEECTRYLRKLYVSEDCQMQVWLIQEHHEPA